MTSADFKTPGCLSFLDQPYVGDADTHVTLAEIRSIREDGVHGTSRIYTALVPTAKLARTLRLQARERWPMQVSDIGADDRDFRIIAPSGDRLEPLVHGWTSLAQERSSSTRSRTAARVSPASAIWAASGAEPVPPAIRFDSSQLPRRSTS